MLRQPRQVPRSSMTRCLDLALGQVTCLRLISIKIQEVARQGRQTSHLAFAKVGHVSLQGKAAGSIGYETLQYIATALPVMAALSVDLCLEREIHQLRLRHHKDDRRSMKGHGSPTTMKLATLPHRRKRWETSSNLSNRLLPHMRMAFTIHSSVLVNRRLAEIRPSLSRRLLGVRGRLRRAMHVACGVSGHRMSCVASESK